MERYEAETGGSGSGSRHGSALAYASQYHAPVLYKAVIDRLIWNRRGTYVDGTLGGGGHAAALLDALDAGAKVIGIDRDADAIHAATTRLSTAIEADRLQIMKGNFSDLPELLSEIGVSSVDGILLDLGVSSYQINTADRGFSYSASGELDMRMDVGSGPTAREIVNEWMETELREMLWEFGEEPRARVLARKIIAARPLHRTEELARVIRSSVPQREETKTLSRVFQAIRIVVNQELEALERALEDSVTLLRNGGRMAVISYHSLEDRRVKRFFRYGNFEGEPHRDFYGNLLTPWKELTRHPVQPDEDELEVNPRARSARLRIAERIEGGETGKR